MEKINLFCFPYAGGSASLFSKWKSMIPDFMELHAIELPGHGKRFTEPLVTKFSTLAKDCYFRIKKHTNQRPYAFFGYSMGSWLVYETYKLINKEKTREPVHIFLAAQEPPHIFKDKTKYHLLADEEFWLFLVKQKGIPEEIAGSMELREIFLPVIKADYKAIETYNRDDIQYNIFNCAVTALIGNQDNITEKEMLEWDSYCKMKLMCYIFKGNHFFIHNNVKNIIKLIRNRIAESNVKIDNSRYL